MPQQDAFGRVTSTPNDALQSQAMDFMLRQALANQQAQVQREGIQSGERVANRGFDTQLAQGGTFGQQSAQAASMQKGNFEGLTGLEGVRGTNALNLQNSANVGSLANTMQQGKNEAGVAGINTAPQMRMADLAATEYGDRAPQVKAEAAEAAQRAGFKGGIYGQLNAAMGGGAPATPGMGAPGGTPGAPGAAGAPSGFSPRFLERAASGALQLPDDPNDAFIRQGLQAAITSGSIGADQLPAVFEAVKSGNLSNLPAFTQHGDPQAQAEYQRIMDPVNGVAAPDLKAIDSLVGNNEFVFTQNNRDQLSRIVTNLIGKLTSQKYSPAVIAQIRNEIASRVANKFDEERVFRPLGAQTALDSLP